VRKLFFAHAKNRFAQFSHSGLRDTNKIEKDKIKMKERIQTSSKVAGEQAHPASPRFHKLRILMKVLIPLIVLGAGIVGASYIKKNAPEPRKRPPRQTIPLVETTAISKSGEQVLIEAMGTVIPAMEIVLKPGVSGEVIEVHPEFTEGGFLRAGEEILRIDPKDYELTVTQKQSQVANTSYALKVEMGQQDIAQREWELLNGDSPAEKLDKELALRKPHLKKVKADMSAARADLNQAKLNLKRTLVVAPFNAVVRTRSVEIGSQVSTGEQLAELVGTDEYLAQVAIPLDRLKWISVPRKAGESGSQVRIRYRNGEYERVGTVIRLLSDLETEGRMARVLVAIPDPLNLESENTDQPPLLLGEYVNAEIEGQELEDVFRIPRTAFRDNDKVWLASADGKLSIRQIMPLWRGREAILVSNGLSDGERLVISNLSTPVDGMAIRVKE